MSRIIIIGNGFDLAHGLKTSYKDLMNFIKEDANLDDKTEGKCGTIHYDKKGFIAFKKERGITNSYNFATCKDSASIYFKKLFYQYNNYNKWTDLETLYFDLLIEHHQHSKKINTLNIEFEYLKTLLEKFLSEKIEHNLPSYIPSFRESFFQGYEKEKLLGIINFNYTKKTVDYHLNYLSNYNKEIYHSNFSKVNIHGELNSNSNPIIFGYGDDNSDIYKSIQNENNDELLKNFKTFQYLRFKNYHRVLAMLELEKDIKIEIIGHSCGLSDKTLLKSIFQHPNVKKIEYQFHNNEEQYFKNIYNISRIFDNNVMMREKMISLVDTFIIPEIILNYSGA